MPVRTEYGMIYGDVKGIKLPFGKDRERIIFTPEGSPCQAIEPEISVVECARKYLRACERDSSKKSLLVPNFVGIIQYPSVQDRDSKRIDAEAKDQLIKQAFTHFAGLCALDIAGMQVEDRFEPFLIHIAYDSGYGMNRGLLAQCFGDKIPSRIVVSPIDKLPQFYQKNPTSTMSLLDRISELSRENLSPREINRRIKPDVEATQKEMAIYGATAGEYGIYAPLAKAVTSIH